jgi:hypothetical protein
MRPLGVSQLVLPQKLDGHLHGRWGEHPKPGCLHILELEHVILIDLH